MKTKITSALALIVVMFTSAAHAGNISHAGYEFIADNSYLGDDGECVQSVFRAIQVSDLLIISGSVNGTSIAVKLNSQQVSQFKKLEDREWGEAVSVKVKVGPGLFTFHGGSCGRMKCDSLEINDGKGTTTLEQPIHGIVNLQCGSK